MPQPEDPDKQRQREVMSSASVPNGINTSETSSPEKVASNERIKIGSALKEFPSAVALSIASLFAKPEDNDKKPLVKTAEGTVVFQEGHTRLINNQTYQAVVWNNGEGGRGEGYMDTKTKLLLKTDNGEYVEVISGQNRTSSQYTQVILQSGRTVMLDNQTRAILTTKEGETVVDIKNEPFDQYANVVLEDGRRVAINLTTNEIVKTESGDEISELKRIYNFKNFVSAKLSDHRGVLLDLESKKIIKTKSGERIGFFTGKFKSINGKQTAQAWLFFDKDNDQQGPVGVSANLDVNTLEIITVDIKIWDIGDESCIFEYTEKNTKL